MGRGTVLHVGLHRTGTTSLQNALAAAREQLSAEGVAYPLAPDEGFTAHHRLACQIAGAETTASPNGLFLPERREFALALRPRLGPAERPSRGAAERMVLSSELFCTFDEAETARLAELVGDIDRVVLYRRGGIGFVHSCWATKVRWGHAEPFDAFLSETLTGRGRTCLAGPVRYVEMLLRRFGEARVRVRAFEAAIAHPRGIAGDFIEGELGLEPIATETEVANPSRPPAVMELFRAALVRAGEPGPPSRRRFGRFVKLLDAPDWAGPIGELVDMSSDALRPIRIDDVRDDSAVVGPDGTLVIEGAASLGTLEGWRFELDQAVLFAPTEALLALLERRPAFARLVAALGSG